MSIMNKRVLVVGTGLSGIAATKLLNSKGVSVTLLDSNDKISESEIRNKLPDYIEVRIILGQLTEGEKKEIDLVVLSPGVPTDLEYINEMRDNGIPIWGEIELAYYYTKGEIVAITGTNGKTTTTALVGEIMSSYFQSVFVVGNIGNPFTNIVLNTEANTVIVAEMSSFQLETIHSFKPKVSAILNITPDHLNRHHSMENYISAKLGIASNQDQTDVCVLNYEDDTLREFGKKFIGKTVFFSSERPLEEGIYLSEDGNIILRENGKEKIILNIRQLNLMGKHNYENVMAAISIALNMNVPIEDIKRVSCKFLGVEHRIEFVTEINRVRYYNDSKGTNPDAAIKGIQAMTTPTLLIGGGYNKESNYKDWICSFEGKVKYLVLLGQTREEIAHTARECDFYNIILVDNLKEAVEFCAKKAEPGDAVLLSPACASWGMFRNYEERGTMFKEYVKNIK
jgi:UDP-N-acetylmuramoylalanine--D-glutamate ligase